jgi:hypothetical protein
MIFLQKRKQVTFRLNLTTRMNFSFIFSYQLPIEIEHVLLSCPFLNYRKESSEKGAWITPTYLQPEMTLETKDY